MAEITTNEDFEKEFPEYYDLKSHAISLWNIFSTSSNASATNNPEDKLDLVEREFKLPIWTEDGKPTGNSKTARLCGIAYKDNNKDKPIFVVDTGTGMMIFFGDQLDPQISFSTQMFIDDASFVDFDDRKNESGFGVQLMSFMVGAVGAVNKQLTTGTIDFTKLPRPHSSMYPYRYLFTRVSAKSSTDSPATIQFAGILYDKEGNFSQCVDIPTPPEIDDSKETQVVPFFQQVFNADNEDTQESKNN